MELPSQGETFQGKYQIHEILGKGGFAAVYRATDMEIGRDVAIKVLAPSEDGYSKGLESRFMREARVIASLRDPHTITMFEFGHSEEGLLFMVFEYVRGTDLSLLTKRSPLPEEAAVHILEQVLQSLREAHAAGVLHRDLKPANILIYEYMDDPYRAKLLDFGIAKAVNGTGVDLTSAGAMIGTPRYMSPEQIYGGDLDARSDIYSLGLVAYEMVCGAPAIKGRSTKEMMVQQLSDTPVMLPPELMINPGLRNVINRMTARDPEQRFGSAEAVIHALDALRGPRMATGRMSPLTGGFQSVPGPPTPQNQQAYYTPQGGYTPQSGPAYGPPNTPTGQQQMNPTPQPNPFPQGRPGTRGMATIPPQPPQPRKGVPMWALAAAGAVVGAALVAAALSVKTEEPKPVVVKKKAAAEARGRSLFETDVGPPEKAADAGDEADASVKPDAAHRGVAAGCGKETDWIGTRQMAVSTVVSRRNFILYIPENYDSSKKYPVVMLYHKAFNGGAKLLKDTNIRPLADEEGFVVFSMEATETTSPWEGAEIEFAEQAFDVVQQELCIDRSRVFAVGHGGGGEFVRQLSCHFALGGIGTAGSGEARGERVCVSDPPVPYIRTAGLQDNYLPAAGGSGCLGGNYKSIREMEEDWKTVNQCEGAAKTWMKQGKDVCNTWECKSPFVSCQLQGGHDWPKSAPEKIEMPGCPYPPPKFPMIEAMWDFFKEQEPVDVEAFYAKQSKKGR